MTAVEIYVDDDLVWSHMWFRDGSTKSTYRRVCGGEVEQAMTHCADWRDYDDTDEDDGLAVQYSGDDTTGIVAEYDYDSRTWTIGDNDYGQTGDVHINGRTITSLIADGVLTMRAV
jgi:outer membrane receptor for Fe3+-dicitrate